jgi:hypothetical protein
VTFLCEGGEPVAKGSERELPDRSGYGFSGMAVDIAAGVQYDP